MNRDILEQPFGPEQIKQREGNFGRMLDYIEGHAVIQRLNDAFDADWSFTIINHEIYKETDEVIVIGQLNAGGIVKSQFGSSRITRARGTGDIVSLADDLKAAATDALKKTATLLGVGLHLYRNDVPQRGSRNPSPPRFTPPRNNGSNGNRNSVPPGSDRNRDSRPYQSNRNGNGGNGGGQHQGNGGGNGNGNGRLTSKQYRFLLNLTEDRGRSTHDLDKQCQEMFGVVASHLSKGDASTLIEQLLAQ
jgi:hypothetical protein